MAACTQVNGISVQSAIKPDTDMLVASRKDTVKAKRAAESGLPVLTYPEFITRFLVDVDVEVGGVPNRYTDKVDIDSLVPCFVHEPFNQDAEFI